MIVTCIICKFDGNVYDYHQWTAEGRKYPDLWICDICATDIR